MNCKNLIHPFQNDPGVSQHQRIIDDLLAGSAKIDGRNMSDMLNYFVQISRHINFQDTDESMKDWQPFFAKSLPFIIANISKFNSKAVNDKMAAYNLLFDKKPSKAGLYLVNSYFFKNIIEPINTWQKQLQNSDLQVELLLNKLIKDKLKSTIKLFITYSNASARYFNTKTLDFSDLVQNDIWGLDFADLYLNLTDAEYNDLGTTKSKKRIALRNKIMALTMPFLEVIKKVFDILQVNSDLEKSLFPLKEELREKHAPHLAILFSFIKLFAHLQDDLNGFSKKHLDFFYKKVLKLKTHEATPDKVHIVFDIQNQLEKYLLKKGLLLKDGKDANKAEIIFATDDEIVVNKAQVADKRTLFLNNQKQGKITYIEGLYMAPDASKADGIDKEFKDDEPASWETLGAKYSKYTDPENKFTKPYPNARLGFILASPVLLLNEGKRTVTITLECELKSNCEGTSSTKTNSCCEQGTGKSTTQNNEYPNFYYAEKLYKKVKKTLNKTYYYINTELIGVAVKKGVSDDLIKKLKKILLINKKKLCFCPSNAIGYEKVISKIAFDKIFNQAEREILKDIFKPRKALNVLFSGEKEWLSPNVTPTFVFNKTSLKTFTITITTALESDQKAVTFYNAEALKEDFDTTQPVVKIELDDKIKLPNHIDIENNTDCCERSFDKKQPISIYHFFRNVVLKDSKIDIQVCGLKNFIVQNDESLQNVNAPIYPFGTRPKVGANFYIGSREVFCKKWNDVRLNLNWKDKPTDFGEYYKGYLLVGLLPDKFQIKIETLDEGNWISKAGMSNKLFDTSPPIPIPSFGLCTHGNDYEQGINISRNDFGVNFVQNHQFSIENPDFKNLDVYSSNGFLKITLTSDQLITIKSTKPQDFLHDDYSYVLARQMMALGKLPLVLPNAIYYNQAGQPIVFDPTLINANITLANGIATIVNDDVLEISSIVGSVISGLDIVNPDADLLRHIINAPPNSTNHHKLKNDAQVLSNILATVNGIISSDEIKKFQAIIPNEPWTPIIKEMSLDYTATATATDIDLIHLYPYHNTFKNEAIELHPTLFPTFCDEGNLFIGLKNFVPGSNLNVLFQLAEATADSETERQDLKWSYLENNTWKSLRKGFEVLDDATDGLTTSGIVKFALPANMTNQNSILPKGLHWIKAAISQNSTTVSEVFAIHTQSIRATFAQNPENDLLRLDKPLPANAISKLAEADASVKKVLQPSEAFGGMIPEDQGQFYVRVSELLRHKGRAIQKFDYERLVLEAFPQIFKAKCINHSFGLDAHLYTNDYPMAPGYVILAAIPDLNKLKAAQQFEPKVPISLLEKIENYIKQRTSPFVRLKVMNPRYERVNFCLKVKLYLGKDENFYKEKLKQDLRDFMAPWAIGEYSKLTFGQCIYRSDIIRFLESRQYIDYLLELKMVHEENGTKPIEMPEVCPITPRSILIAGDIDVCIATSDCEHWDTDNSCQNQAETFGVICK